jgi:hypothetical protein
MKWLWNHSNTWIKWHLLELLCSFKLLNKIHPTWPNHPNRLVHTFRMPAMVNTLWTPDIKPLMAGWRQGLYRRAGALLINDDSHFGVPRVAQTCLRWHHESQIAILKLGALVTVLKRLLLSIVRIPSSSKSLATSWGRSPTLRWGRSSFFGQGAQSSQTYDSIRSLWCIEGYYRLYKPIH